MAWSDLTVPTAHLIRCHEYMRPHIYPLQPCWPNRPTVQWLTWEILNPQEGMCTPIICSFTSLYWVKREARHYLGLFTLLSLQSCHLHELCRLHKAWQIWHLHKTCSLLSFVSVCSFQDCLSVRCAYLLILFAVFSWFHFLHQLSFWDFSLFLLSPTVHLSCYIHLSSPPVIPNSWQARLCLVVTLHPRRPEPVQSSMWEPGPRPGFWLGVGGLGQQDGPSHHNHSLPAGPSVLSLLSLLLLFCLPHVTATRHAYQLIPGWSESTGSGGRRLVNSPEAAECSHQLMQTDSEMRR